jgi:predicted nucleic acid-binding protein
LGLLLDTSILIAAERRGGNIRDVLSQARLEYGNAEIGISAISIVELTHGIYRADNDDRRERRRVSVERALDALIVYPATLEITRLAGQIEGEQAARGISIPFQDLLIGCTALYLGFDVATQNVRHFKLIPDLKIVAL